MSVNPIQKTLVTLYCIYAAVFAAITFYFIVLCYYPGPFRDMWIAMDFVRAWFEGDVNLVDAFALHGGAHRLAVPKFLFLIEYGLFDGSNRFLILVSIFCQLMVVWLVYLMLKVEAHISRSHQVFFVAVALVLMFNTTQLENFIYTFDTQWFITSSFAVLALMLWVDGFDKQAAGAVAVPAFIGAITATAISIFSSFSGVCLLFVVPLIAFVRGIEFKRVVAITVLCLLVVALYMKGPFGASEVEAGGAAVGAMAFLKGVLSALLKLMKWTALYFGSPLGRSSFLAGMLFSYVSLLFLLLCWVRILLKNLEVTRFQLVCLAVALFAVAVGVSTGLGRLYFVNIADEDRYQSIVLVYWMGVFGYLYSRGLQISITGNHKLRNTAFGLILFWTMGVLPIASLADARAHLDFFDRVRNANVAIAVEQYAFQAIKPTLILGDKAKKINRPEMHAPWLREKGWGVYSSEPYNKLGARVDTPEYACEAGGVGAIKPLGEGYPGYVIHGKAAVDSDSMANNLLILDQSNTVVGFGRLQRKPGSLLPAQWQDKVKARWKGYFVPGEEVQEIRVIGKVPSGDMYCVVGSAKIP